MIKLLIFGFIFVCAVYAWFPDYTWAITPVFAVIAVLWLIIKILRDIHIPSNICHHTSIEDKLDKHEIEDKWDEYDWWQDNQGL